MSSTGQNNDRKLYSYLKCKNLPKFLLLFLVGCLFLLLLTPDIRRTFEIL